MFPPDTVLSDCCHYPVFVRNKKVRKGGKVFFCTKCEKPCDRDDRQGEAIERLMV